jgi:hypothetical protein
MMTTACLLSVGYFLPALAPPVKEPPSVIGWRLKISLSDSNRSDFYTGESLGRQKVQVTLQNDSGNTRSYIPLAKAQEHWILTFTAKKNERIVDTWLVAPPFAYKRPKELPTLAHGKSTTTEFELSQFGYRRFVSPGILQLQAVLQTDAGEVRSNIIEFHCNDIQEKSICVTKDIPLAGEETRRSVLGEAARVAIQRIQHEKGMLLIYRRYTGPKFGSKTEVVERLAIVDTDTDFIVAGEYGKSLPLTIAYQCPPSSIAILELHSERGQVVKKTVYNK